MMMEMVIYTVHVKILSTGIKKYVSLTEKSYKKELRMQFFFNVFLLLIERMPSFHEKAICFYGREVDDRHQFGNQEY